MSDTSTLAQGLHAKELVMAYGRKSVLRGLSLPVLAPGQVCALIGPNAAGKSTLLRGLAGLQSMQGQVFFDGVDITAWSQVRRAQQLVYLPQSLPSRSNLVVFEAVLSAAMAGRGQRMGDALTEVEAVLQRLDLHALANRSLAQLSGGQRQMVGLAQALVRQPRALLLDEPTSALDLYHQHLVLDRVRQAARAHNLVVLVVLHDLHLALACADQVLVLQEGELVAAGTPEQVIDAHLLAHVYRVQARIVMVDQRPCLSVAGAL